MNVSVIVPFGADNSPAGRQRAKVWRWNHKRWDRLRTTGLVDEVVAGHDPLFGRVDFERPYAKYPLDAKAPGPHPFSVSRALNAGARAARGDVFLLFGADHVPDPHAIGWALGQLRSHPWARIYDVVLYASEAVTHLIVDGPFGDNLYDEPANWRRHSAPCPGVLALTRAAWEKAGGMDERFAGWGYEDTEFLSRLSHHVPGGTTGPCGLPLRELYVPSNRDLRGENLTLFSQITTERGW